MNKIKATRDRIDELKKYAMIRAKNRNKELLERRELMSKI